MTDRQPTSEPYLVHPRSSSTIQSNLGPRSTRHYGNERGSNTKTEDEDWMNDNKPTIKTGDRTNWSTTTTGQHFMLSGAGGGRGGLTGRTFKNGGTRIVDWPTIRVLRIECCNDSELSTYLFLYKHHYLLFISTFWLDVEQPFLNKRISIINWQSSFCETTDFLSASFLVVKSRLCYVTVFIMYVRNDAS